MIQEWLLFGVSLVFAVAGGFLFAMAETSFSALRRWQIRSIIVHPDSNTEKFRQLLSNREAVLAVFVLGNALSNGVFILCGLWIVIKLSLAPELVFIAQFLFILLVTEVLPKALVVSNPAHWALRLQSFFIWSYNVMAPLTTFLLRINDKLFFSRLPREVKSQQPVSDDDIEQLLEIASHKGAIGNLEKEIIHAIITLDNQTADDAMNPRLELDGVEVTATPDEMLAAARKHRHRRLILYRQNKEHIVGFLNTRTYLLTRNLEEAFEVPSYVPESINLLTLFVSLQKQRRGIAVVLDEFGSPSGIITMEDILEEIVGNIQSEGRADEKLIKIISPGHWVVKGNARVEDFQESYASIKENDEIDTLGGLFLSVHQVIPKPGDTIQYGPYHFKILQVDEKRILEMEIWNKKKVVSHPLNKYTSTASR